MPRRFTRVLLLALLLAPVLGTISLSPSSTRAQDEISEESTEVPSDGTPTAEPALTEEPSAAPEETATETPAETGTPTDVPTETGTPTDVPTKTGTPTDVPTETPEPTETESPTSTPTNEPPATPDSVTGADLAAPSDLAIVLSCATNPETIRITNNGAGTIVLTGVGTLFGPRSDEPFALNQQLLPGKSQLYRAGPAATIGVVLTTAYIFANSAYEADGVLFTTSAGDVSKSCAPKPDPVVANPGKLSDLSITLNCRANQESVRVTNNGNGYFLLKTIGTTYEASSKEPFTVNQVLKPKSNAFFSAGAGASQGTILTKGFIFSNSAWEKDGVRVLTSAGTASKACEKKPVPAEHWVEVNLSTQFLRAWDGNKLVNSTYVSTGKPGFDTPTGTFYILIKYRYDDMEGTIGGEYYNVPAVPWTMYFTNYGHALHGAYWHNDFGHVRSHGCVNLPLGFAEWLYYWLPYGGRVVIHY